MNFFYGLIVNLSYFSLNDNLCHTCPTGFTSNYFSATYNTNYCYYVDTTQTDFDSAKTLCSTKAAGATLLRIVDSTTLTYATSFASLFLTSTGVSPILLWVIDKQMLITTIKYETRLNINVKLKFDFKDRFEQKCRR